VRTAVRAEWTKLWTTPGAALLMFATGTVTVALGAVLSAVMTCPRAGCELDPTRIGLTGVQLGQALVAVLAVLVVGGEYSTGLIAVTVLALPRRPAVLAAKAAVLALPTAAVGCVAVLACLLIAQPPVHGPTVRAGVGSVLYLVLIGWLALGIAAAVRDSAASIGLVLGLVYLPAILAQVVGDPQWQRFLSRAGPMSAGLTVQVTTGLRDLPLSPWAGLGVLAGWAAAALLTGGLLLHLRDV
jgi:ABC-2 type transport system permease protein